MHIYIYTRIFYVYIPTEKGLKQKPLAAMLKVEVAEGLPPAGPLLSCLFFLSS